MMPKEHVVVHILVLSLFLLVPYSWNIANVGVKQQSLTPSTGSGTYHNYIIHVNVEENKGR